MHINIDVYFSLTIGIGGINEGFLLLLQNHEGWTDGTDRFHFNFWMDGLMGLDLLGQVWTGLDGFESLDGTDGTALGGWGVGGYLTPR